jgi:membrane protease subunit (stomatin/prohibitin family)
VWYVNKTIKRDLKWGTRSPIPLLDEKLGYSVNVRAYGRWGIRVHDSRSFITQLVGTQKHANSEIIEQYFIGEIIQNLTDALSNYFISQGISILQANAKLNELSQLTAKAIKMEFDRFGIEVINFNVERINIPEEDMREIQLAQKERMRMKQMQDAKVSNAYISMRTFDTLEKAAQNEGNAGGTLAGGMGIGMGMGAGFPLGQQIGQSMNINSPQANHQQYGNNQTDPIVKLQKLTQLLESGLITQEDFELKKKEILDNI